MNARLAACLFALVLVVAGVLFVVAGGRDRSTRDRGEPAAAPAPETPAPALVAGDAAAPAVAADAVREETPPIVAPVTPASWRAELAGLTGRVVESDATPVAGIRVALLEAEASLLFDAGAIEGDEPTLELEETVTDDEGRFVLGGARAPAFHALGVDLGGPRATIRIVDQALTHRARTDVGDVVLAPYGVLTGRVIDESGAPVPGARVRFGPFPEEILQASLQEFRSDSVVAVNLKMVGVNETEVIEPPGWIRSALDRLPIPTTYSAADGTFRLEGVALAKVVGGVDKRGCVGVPLGPIDASGGEQALGDIVLARGRTVRGVVEDAYGEAQAGVEVMAGAELFGVAAILQPCGRTDADGRFELTGVAATGQIVAVCRRVPHEPWSTAVTPDHERVLIEIEGSAALTVHVRDVAGKPLGGARVQLAPRRRSKGSEIVQVFGFLPRRRSPAGTFREVEPGRYVLASLGVGLYDVTARVPGLAPGHLQVECLGTANEVTLVCAPGRAIELQVIDATRAPVAGARASVLGTGPSGLSKLFGATTDHAGSARLGPLPDPDADVGPSDSIPVETLLLVQHPRFADHSSSLDVDASPLVVELTTGGSLAGRVHWGGAIPTRVYMVTVEDRGADGFLEMFHLPRFTVTDLAGEFRMANLLPGKYGLTLSDRFLDKDPAVLMEDDFGIATLHDEEFEIRTDETTEIVIDLTPTGRGATARVVGRVRFEGRSLEGAKVRVNGNESVHVVTDAGGWFETPLFAVRGTTWIEIEGEVPTSDGGTRRMELHRQSVELAHGDVHEIDLDLRPLKLGVAVSDAVSGEPIVDAHVSGHAESGSSAVGGTMTGSAGEAELLIFEPGAYRLTVGAEGFASLSTRVEVPPEGLPERTAFRLRRPVPCAGRVLVDAATGGQPGGMAFIQVHGAQNGASSGARLVPPDYTFTLEGLAEDRYTTWIYIDGQQSKEGSFELGPEGTQDLVLEFVPNED